MTEPADEAPVDPGVDSRIDTRAELLPEEEAAGSEVPRAQAEAILAESEERTQHPEETQLASTQTPDDGRSSD